MMVRIIPAFAGSTRGRGPPCRSARDHPRIRGEHARNLSPRCPLWGSSPHSRGARPQPFAAVPPLGIIPAFAGSTGWRMGVLRRLEDHPRIRGEHWTVSTPSASVTGSSPHSRGALSREDRSAVGDGIIPAFAGSTPEAPRLREHDRGSSPHSRGARKGPQPEGHGPGIIPACAGSTGPVAAQRRRVGDHPRMRGEHWTART